MAKKEEKESVIDVRKELLKSPGEIVVVLQGPDVDLEFTKVVQTYVSEDGDLSLELEKDGKTFFSGEVIWIGNRRDGGMGVEICVKVDKGTRTIIPTPDTTKEAHLDLRKKNPTIHIKTLSRVRCAVCGKGLEIFDETSSCPICAAKAHTEHMVGWIQKENGCPVCKKALQVGPNNEVYVA